jgi:hypothetical protein
MLTIAFVATARLAIGQGAKTPPTAVSPFVEKTIITVYAKSSSEMGAVLSNVEVKKLGEHLFLVGKDVGDDPEAFYTGQLVWVAIDDVSQIAEFKDIESCKKAASAKKAL